MSVVLTPICARKQCGGNSDGGEMLKISVIAAGLLLLAGPADAADFEQRFEGTKPAVSGVNAKISFGYAQLNTYAIDHDHLGFGEASVSVPIGQRFGAQLDGALIRDEQDTIAGLGAHLFWRNPDVALAGLYGDFAKLIGAPSSFYRIGPEAEIYLGPVSLEGFAGVQGESSGGKLRFAGDLTAAIYPTDNFRLHAGVIRSLGATVGRVGGEYLMQFNGLSPSIFADGYFGNGGTEVRAGLRFYFGGQGKTLISRHRQDDPKNRILDLVAVSAGVGREEFKCPPGTFDDGTGVCFFE